MEDRSWAVGLEQSEFEQQFQRRNPMCDVIPDVKSWAGPQAEKDMSATMTPFNPEQMVEDGPPPKPKEEIADYKMCPACGKKCATPNGKLIGYRAHVRNCRKNITDG
jgi:hypothetical protein